MVNSQSRSLSLPQRGSASCSAMKVENAVFLESKLAYDESMSGNDVTKGVYNDRYGKWDSRIGDRGGVEASGE